MKNFIISVMYAVIWIIISPSKISAQQHKTTVIKGIVTSATSNEPLAGAMIYYSGKTVTRADNDGRFSFSTSVDTGTIVVSYVGFNKAILQYNTGKSFFFPVRLTPLTVELETVAISTGYQTIPKERATGAFTVLNNTQLNQQTGSNILSRLEGISSGVQFDKDGQRPAITVRGLSSINASTSPLIVIDNFPYSGNIENINPNNIESVTILKDAAAASIWGAKAGNGVIVITTKKGKFNQPVNIDFNANVSIRKKPNIYKARNFISSADFIDLEESLFNNGYYNDALGNTDTYPVVSPVVDLLAKRQTASEAEKLVIDQTIRELKKTDVRKDIDKYLYQIGLNQQYALNIQGGADKISYSFFAGYDQNKDYLANVYDRISLRSQSNFKLTKGLNLTTGILFTQSNDVKGKPDYTSIRSSLTQGLFPYAQLADQNGSSLPVVNTYRQDFIAGVGNGKLLNWKYYPLEDYKYTDIRNKVQDLLANLGLNYQALPWLNLDVKYQYERQQNKGKSQYNEGSFFTNDLINKFTQISNTGEVKYVVPRGSILDLSESVLSGYNLRSQISIDKTWGQHALYAIAGGEISEQKTDGGSYRTYGYNDDLGVINGLLDPVNSYPLIYGGTSTIGNSNIFNNTVNRLVSYYLNASYTFKQRYTLSSSARSDRSNLFGVNTNQKGRPFWSAGLSWDISQEPFYHSSNIPNLKFRATYGYSGNVDNSLSALTTIRYSNGVNLFTGFKQASISKFENPELRWEKTGIFNLGLDFLGHNQRISGSIDYYNKKGTDLLGDALVDITTGLRTTTVRRNVASMKGKGIDIVLNSKNFIHTLKWSSTFLFNFNRNKVNEYYLDTYQGSTYVNTQGRLITPIPGYPVYSIFSYRSAGLDPANGDPRGYLNGVISKDYTALIGTGTQVEDLIFNGSSTPIYSGALGNTFNWKNLSLSLNITYKLGYYFTKSSISYNNLFVGWNQNDDYDKRWRKAGDESVTNIPSLLYHKDSNRDDFYTGSENLVHKADHIRLQYVNLSYLFNKEQFRRFPLKNLELNINASDLGIIWRANKENIDPDYPYSIPLSRSITFGIRSTF